MRVIDGATSMMHDVVGLVHFGEEQGKGHLPRRHAHQGSLGLDGFAAAAQHVDIGRGMHQAALEQVVVNHEMVQKLVGL